MANLKDPKYLTKLNKTTSTFVYNVTSEGEYFVDYNNGLSQIDVVVDRLKKLSKKLNRTSEDVKTMLSAYVLDDTVDIDSFVNAVNGGMNSMASQMSTTIQDILVEAKTRMENSRKLDEMYLESQSKKTSEIVGATAPAVASTIGNTPKTNETPTTETTTPSIPKEETSVPITEETKKEDKPVTTSQQEADNKTQKQDTKSNDENTVNKTGKKITGYTYEYDKTIKCTDQKDVSLSGDSLNGYIAQGMTDAGKYKIYGFIKKSGDNTIGSAIRIVDKNGKTVKTFTTNDASVIGHVNDLEYDAKTGKVYVATMNKDNPLRSFNLNDFVNSKSNNIKFKDESKLFEATGLKSVSGVTIDDSTGKVYLSLGDKIKVVSDDKVVQTIIKPDNNSTSFEHKSQGIFAKDGDLYVIRYNDSSSRSNGGTDVRADSPTASANMVDIYHEGQYVKTVSVEAPTFVNSQGNRVIGEMESITYNEKTGKYNANFYYSGGYSTTEIKL